MKGVYVAGALNDMAVGYIKNVHRMIVCAERVRRAGFGVFVPCLDLLMGIMLGDYVYDDYFYNSQVWLEKADAVFVCPGWKDSKGTIREIKYATELGIPVYFDIEILKEDLG